MRRRKRIRGRSRAAYGTMSDASFRRALVTVLRKHEDVFGGLAEYDRAGPQNGASGRGNSA